MSFNPGCASSVDDKNVFVPEDTKRVELETELSPASSAGADSLGKPVKVAIYTMIDEDDGIGTLLKQELLNDPRVSYGAHRIPHRQEALLKIRFHVPADVDPQLVLHSAIERSLRKIDQLAASLSSAKPTLLS